MSRENVELVVSAFEIYSRGEIDAAIELLHPDIEWVVAKEHPDARTVRGREAVAAYRREWDEMLDELRVEMDRIVDAQGAVVLLGTVRGVGVGSGAEVEVPIAFVHTFQDGKIIRVAEYIDPAEALEAAGLRE
jgi:ketosteroid isomerase-like protein